MSRRLVTLLCLSGLAACSHNTENAKDPTSVNEASVGTEPAMTPASLEDGSAPTPAPDLDPDRSSNSEKQPSPAADNKSTGANDMRATGSSPSTAPPPAEPPKATTGPGAAPDNTKVNKRDRDSANPTPLDQGNNETDLKITQQIRQAVMADGSLSFTAKNVKIITMNGKVTLRGPVNTAQERTAIEAAARKVAGAQVDNQLEVKK